MRESMSRPSRSVPSRKSVPPSAGQTKWKRPGRKPQKSYESPRQKNLSG